MLHPFLEKRSIVEAYIVVLIGEYKFTRNDRGGFSPGDCDKRMTGTLWPSYQDAEVAARFVTKQTGDQYGVFKLVSIVEKASPPVDVTLVA